MPVVVPILLVSAGIGALIVLTLAATERPVPVHEPDIATPGSTGYKLVDKILPLLRQASESSHIPLGLLVGWIAKESGGRLDEVTSRDERGYFQLDPRESKALGLDHQRLSTDATYSINGGLALIGSYMKVVDQLGVAPSGSDYYWRLVKLCHTMGDGAVKQIIAMAKAAGETRTWQRLEDFALANEAAIKNVTKHSASKWFPFVDVVARTGAPFGFGGQDVVVGGEVFTDIVDPLDVLAAL